MNGGREQAGLDSIAQKIHIETPCQRWGRTAQGSWCGGVRSGMAHLAFPRIRLADEEAIMATTAWPIPNCLLWMAPALQA